MPSATITDALKEAYICAPSNIVVLETIQFSHPLLPTGSLYLVRDKKDAVCTLETAEVVTFKACDFSISLPKTGENGIQEIDFRIDNVDRQASDFIEQVRLSNDPVTVIYRPYLSTDLSTPQMVPPLMLYLTDVSIGVLEVSAKATFCNLLNKPFPNEIYTRTKFPTLGQ